MSAFTNQCLIVGVFTTASSQPFAYCSFIGYLNVVHTQTHYLLAETFSDWFIQLVGVFALVVDCRVQDKRFFPLRTSILVMAVKISSN